MVSSNEPGGRKSQVIRVFISSTFLDMQAERDELVKVVFPQIREMCEDRGVTWGEVDLRWGITDEQSAEGRVLPICLDEVRRCRPYFIGLLGERYGWVPDEIPPELIEREPWLAEHLEHSVTELEILHGVLNNPDMAEHAYFYFRDPAYAQSLSLERQAHFCEIPSDDDIAQLGREAASRKAAKRRQKLANLKDRIRRSAFPVREGYRDPKQLGEWVLYDLTQIIDRLYPADARLSPLDREAAEHEEFAFSRAQVYIGRRAYDEQLDAHAAGSGPPLVVLGESGSGKSALLANWGLRYQAEHPDDLVLMHFIGATPASSDWGAMLRRIMGEFKRRYDIREDIPTRPEALRAAFSNWLHRAAARGRVILILDALNQLEDREGALDLAWMPGTGPDTMRIIFSTLPGRPLDELKRRNWPTLTVQPLQIEERSRLIREYLALFTKELSPQYMERIATAEPCRNPLYLRVLLDELRFYGVHERLGERIEEYLKAATISALYERILARCEKDYERGRAGLVRESMSLLWASRHGLSEAELLELLGSDGKPMPQAYWSPLYVCGEQSLISRSGLICFFHDYLRQAIEHRYLPDDTARMQVHRRIAHYFAAQPAKSPRRLAEYPWQLARAGAWRELYTLLGDLAFFSAAWETHADDVRTYWSQVQATSPYRMLDAYRPLLDEPERYETVVWHVSTVLNDEGHPAEALHLRTYLEKAARERDDKAGLAQALLGQANILQTQGETNRAMVLLKEQEQLSRQLGDVDGLQQSLGTQGVILRKHGDLDGAMALYNERERICRESGDMEGLHVTLGNQAIILAQRGDLDGAIRLTHDKERICRELGDKDGLSTVLGNLSIMLTDKGDLDGAMELAVEKEAISRELGLKRSLQRALACQAFVMYARHAWREAMALYKQEESLCRELGDQAALQASLGNQSRSLLELGDVDTALALSDEEARLAREQDDPDALANCLMGRALILGKIGDKEAAYHQLDDARKIADEHGFQYIYAEIDEVRKTLAG